MRLFRGGEHARDQWVDQSFAFHSRRLSNLRGAPGGLESGHFFEFGEDGFAAVPMDGCQEVGSKIVVRRALDENAELGAQCES